MCEFDLNEERQKSGRSSRRRSLAQRLVEHGARVDGPALCESQAGKRGTGLKAERLRTAERILGTVEVAAAQPQQA